MRSIALTGFLLAFMANYVMAGDLDNKPYSYQYDAFAEMASEFGKFHLLHLAVSMQY